MADDDPNASGNSRRHIIAECEASLKRLKTDYIDLYQIHRSEPGTAIDETLRALDRLDIPVVVLDRDVDIGVHVYTDHRRGMRQAKILSVPSGNR